MVGVNRPLRIAALAALLASPACVGCGGDPSKKLVAEVGGKPVTVGAVETYLQANLVSEPGVDAPSDADLARVKSRLFDDYIDEEVQLREAEKRGVTVTDAELADYLGSEHAPDAARRDLARREMTIQKLRESVVRAGVEVSEADVDAWLLAHAGDAKPAIHGTIRTLRFASLPEAERVRKDIVSGKLSVLEASVTYAEAAGGAPREVELAALPDRIAAAVAQMKPGDVSQPVPWESSVLLLLLDSKDDPSDAEARLREKARQTIGMERSQSATDEFLGRLRKSTPVTIHEKALPFSYVPESAP